MDYVVQFLLDFLSNSDEKMITVEHTDDTIWLFENKGVKKIKFTPYFYIKDKDGKNKTIYGDSCSKYPVKKPSDIYNAKQVFDKTYESDVNYTNRFLTDYYDEIKLETIHKCYIDIETEMLAKFPDVIEAPATVQSISLYDSEQKKYVAEEDKDEKETASLDEEISMMGSMDKDEAKELEKEVLLVF
jgi:hypothetical protein